MLAGVAPAAAEWRGANAVAAERRLRVGLLWALVLLPCSMGGCPRPEDALEPNDTPESATALTIGQAIGVN